MKHALLLLLFFVTVHVSYAQRVVYNELAQDVVFEIPAESNKDLLFDIDEDNADDMQFVSFNFPSFGIWNLGVAQIDSNNPKVEILINTNVPKSQIGDYYASQLSINDEVSSSASFSNDYPQIGDIYYVNFNGQTDKYLGFRMNVGASDFKYGWMAIDFSGDGDLSFTIKEYAYQDQLNTAIDAGQTVGVGIKHVGVEVDRFGVYPNPVKNHVNIKATEGAKVDQLRIYSVQGKLITEVYQPALPLTIETTDWDQGAYLIEILDDINIFREMLIKN